MKQVVSAKLFSLYPMLLLLVILTACQAAKQPAPFLSAEPAVDSTLTRAPRTLRLYFRQLPDVARSMVTLQAADGSEVPVRGMHTMGANDLMMEINAALADGRYTVNWTTVVEGDSSEYAGSFSFVVQSN